MPFEEPRPCSLKTCRCIHRSVCVAMGPSSADDRLYILLCGCKSDTIKHATQEDRMQCVCYACTSTGAPPIPRVSRHHPVPVSVHNGLHVTGGELFICVSLIRGEVVIACAAHSTLSDYCDIDELLRNPGIRGRQMSSLSLSAPAPSRCPTFTGVDQVGLVGGARPWPCRRLSVQTLALQPPSCTRICCIIE